MSTTLVRHLLRLVLANPHTDELESARLDLKSATQSQWQQALETLALHRLLPLVAYSLEKRGFTDPIPPAVLEGLQASYRQTLAQNTIFLLSLAGILRAMEARKLHPVLWKGIVLADSFYPDLGTRPMTDIDFSIPGDELEEAIAAFASLGFVKRDHMTTEDAIYVANAMGVYCDVHHRVRLFEGKESMNLTVDVPPQQLQVPTFRILEPNAMLVHLVFHLNGHLNETGLMLSWILDIAFVLRQWGSSLAPARLQQLMPEKRHWVSLFRILRFLEAEFDEPIPECLAASARNFAPFTLGEILRQRRLTMWELPHWRGWLRLGASRLGIELKRGYPTLQGDDLLGWVTDAATARRMASYPISQ
ncbi:MAG TPA: nucleotidyltransferase family protein [Oscillatoriales cyanobacterium M59_W2019_021]|nr:MAG: hypothetical protein D6728_10525 [Cyanobacteria bacterium J055]HIK29957.1 nucleotidyltransferase family protein [Oscillatoriales cyanobacterium M4454_W2019_049]HIK51262.1 nucleotidyltransferase family protein [Oscillatoriales cyanobacterium M59_W2019_021]